VVSQDQGRARRAGQGAGVPFPWTHRSPAGAGEEGRAGIFGQTARSTALHAGKRWLMLDEGIKRENHRTPAAVDFGMPMGPKSSSCRNTPSAPRHLPARWLETLKAGLVRPRCPIPSPLLREKRSRAGARLGPQERQGLLYEWKHGEAGEGSRRAESYRGDDPIASILPMLDALRRLPARGGGPRTRTRSTARIDFATGLSPRSAADPCITSRFPRGVANIFAELKATGRKRLRPSAFLPRLPGWDRLGVICFGV